MLAIDIILVPPEDVMDAAISINHKLVSDQKTPLNKTDFLPHISLLMGSIEESKLPELRGLLQPLVDQTLPLELSAHFENREFSMLMIDRTPKLQVLHKAVLNQTQDLVGSDVNAHNLFDHNVDQKWISYMSSFRANSSGERFDPHITIGRGQVEGLKKNITFQVQQIAVGRLGDRCTVRKLLFQT